MKKHILFFDIDGTLIDAHSHRIPASTKIALTKLKEDGHIVCIATGRSLSSVIEAGFTKLIHWDAYLCNNGQAIYDHEFSILHMEAIPSDTVYGCIEKANALDAPLLLMGEKNILTKKPNAYVFDSLDFFKEQLPVVQDYDGSAVVMMIAYGPMGYDYADYKTIKGIDVIPGQSSYADIVLKGYHKHIGIQEVLKYFHKEEYIAFGDSLNDIEMIKHAKLGIAMGNAHDDLKTLAYYVSDDVSSDGIYNALIKFHILEE